MQPNSYPDGFPINPIEAINFSYFLSDQEKQEWLSWLQNSTQDQQRELVDTLHSMWLENQKDAVPQGFNLSSNQSSTPTPAAIPVQEKTELSNTIESEQQPTPVSNQSSASLNNNVQQPTPDYSNLNSSQITEPVAILPQESQPPMSNYPVQNVIDNSNRTDVQPEKKQTNDENVPIVKNNFEQVIPLINSVPNNLNYNRNQTNQPKAQLKPRENQSSNSNLVKVDNNENIKQFGQSKYTPNPLLDDKSPSPEDFVFQNNPPKNKNNRRSDVRQEGTEDNMRQNSNKMEEQSSSTNDNNSAKKSFFNFSKLREVATRKSLEELYQQFLKSRTSSFSAQKEYEDDHALFLDKIMGIVVNFESVSDYFEVMTQKLLEMNDQNLALAEKFSVNEETNRSTIRDLSRQVADLRLDLDRSYRYQKQIEEEVSRVSIKSKQVGVDVFGGEATQQKMEILLSRIAKLEQLTPGMSIKDRLSNLQKEDEAKALINSSSSKVDNEIRTEEKNNLDAGPNVEKRRIDIKNLF